MGWDDVKELIGDAAPLLGGLAAGNRGGGANLIIASVLGCKPTPIEIEKALNSKPDALKDLAEAEKLYATELREIALEEIKAGIIRPQCVSAQKESTMPAVVTILMFAVLAYVMYELFNGDIPISNKTAADALINNLLPLFATVIGFWVGRQSNKSG